MSDGYYKALLSAFAQTISEHHDINLKAISKADGYRFITHVENVNGHRYKEFTQLEPAALQYCKSELIKVLNIAILDLGNAPSFQLNL